VIDLAALLDAAEFDGLAIDKQPTGFTASILAGTSDWSDRVWASSASEAVEKCLKKHAPARTVLAPPPY
jgi:hypothetical protein